MNASITLVLTNSESAIGNNFAPLDIVPSAAMEFIAQYFELADWSGKSYFWQEYAPVEC